jgi:isopentenyl-diphosphate delta-isomerase
LAIHLNALQEAVQFEGQTNFAGVLAKIAEVAAELDVPVIVKETGSGIAAEEARKLEAAGVKGIDVGGLGGTSFAAVEHYRTAKTENNEHQWLGEVFWDWGIPTVASLVEVTQSTKVPVVASGGVRNGTIIAKALALNAKLASVAHPVLQTAVKSVAETERLLSRLTEELRNVMFLVGAQDVEHLAKTPLLVTGNTSRWLKNRGFDVKSYGTRGST